MPTYPSRVLTLLGCLAGYLIAIFAIDGGFIDEASADFAIGFFPPVTGFIGALFGLIYFR